MNFNIFTFDFSYLFIFLLLSFPFILLSSVKAQVKIKEKVEIKPKWKTGKKLLNETTSTSHSLKVIANWAKTLGPDPVTAKLELYYDNHSLGIVESQSSPIEVSSQISVNQKIYCASISWHNPLGHMNYADIDMKMYLDGKIIKQSSHNNYYTDAICEYVEFPKCGADAPECNGEPETPEIKTEEVTFKSNICRKTKNGDTRRGAFIPHWEDLYSPYSVEVCFNKNKNVWQYGIKNNGIKLQYQLTICMDNLSSLYTKLLYSLNDVNTNNIPDSKYSSLAFNNFKAQIPYGGGNGNYYFIVEAVIKHENIHKQDWVDMLNVFSKSWRLSNVIVGYKPNCDEVNNYDDVLKKGKNHISETLKSFGRSFKKKWLKKIGKTIKDRKDYEEETQKRVRPIIRKYIEKLKAIYPKLVIE